MSQDTFPAITQSIKHVNFGHCQYEKYFIMSSVVYDIKGILNVADPFNKFIPSYNQAIMHMSNHTILPTFISHSYGTIQIKKQCIALGKIRHYCKVVVTSAHIV